MDQDGFILLFFGTLSGQVDTHYAQFYLHKIQILKFLSII